MTRQTIKGYAQRLLIQTDFVDCYGRNVGFDYETILARIKRRFPKARTSKRALRFVLYTIDRSVRLPARRRSRHTSKKEYAKSLLTVTDKKGLGLSYANIANRASRKFPRAISVSLDMLLRFERKLVRDRVKMPEKRA